MNLIFDRFPVVEPLSFSYPWLTAFTTLAQRGNQRIDFMAGSCEAQRRELEVCLAPLAVTWLTLEHGAATIDIEQDTHRFMSPLADAALVTEPGTAVAFTTADCLPLICVSEQPRIVAGIHAGWRGLADGVIEETILRLCRVHAVELSSLKVWIAPPISKEDYEVSDTVREKLMARFAVTEDFFVQSKPGHWFADLPGAATAILTWFGVAIEHIEHYPISTKQSPLLHSARRDGEASGRMATVVGIKA